ncbi:DNA/RNA helicase domain-containing protein [Cellulomonas sp.]|uniref:DNA/RNA helicase domain-containing protein n=1 Tax=Cellulomonas sp. TaxID=40001 RepID=UPI003457475A
MAGETIARFAFDSRAVDRWSRADRRHMNWPVVYVIDDQLATTKPGARTSVYVGESLSAATRMRQHLDATNKQGLRTVRVIIDDEFNKSVCLDLEAYLIGLFSGDDAHRVINLNVGVRDADYFQRERYRRQFREVFEALRAEGLFSRSLPEIENSNLFKLSPFKALSEDQAVAVEGILEGLFADLTADVGRSIVIQGSPGTGKTVVAIYLMKVLLDIARTYTDDDIDQDGLFVDFFAAGYRELLHGFRIGLVVPQQSLRASIKAVFAKTPGLRPEMVLSPFDVGKATDKYDLLIVDEAHRLSQRANQPSGPQNQMFRHITERLFGYDDVSRTQLDWIRAQSKQAVFLVDGDQSVRPADLPTAAIADLVSEARRDARWYPLMSQMRVAAGADYVQYVRDVLTGRPGLARQVFEGYDLRFYDDLAAMRDAVRRRDDTHSLARLVAGYAWDWVSKKDPTAFDIIIGGVAMRWNSAEKDWINSSASVDEVGSIHTVQGYDLNYAGVIIGKELRYDARSGRLLVDRASYRDRKGKENNPTLGVRYSDEDLLRYIVNIYSVLLTRGMLGTYVYVCDPELREYLRGFFSNVPG